MKFLKKNILQQIFKVICTTMVLSLIMFFTK